MWLGLQATLQSLTPEAGDQADHSELDLVPLIPSLAHSGHWHLHPLQIRPEHDLKPLPLSFEQVLQNMEQAGNIYAEGDGSFALCGNDRCSAENQQILWLGKDGQVATLANNPDWFTDAEQRSTWKIEGNLFDGQQSVDHCTLVGYAPVTQWQYLLQVIAGQDSQDLVFQFQQLGIFCSAQQILSLEL